MLEDVTKWVATFAPFLAPYPGWVKSAFVICVLSGASCLIGLVVAAPRAKDAIPSKEVASSSTSDATRPYPPRDNVWLTILGVRAYGGASTKAIRVRFKVNGIEYTYPNAPGVKWQAFGFDQTTAQQSFRIPLSDSYTVNFLAELEGGGEWLNAEDQHVKIDPTEVYRFSLHDLTLMVRGSNQVAEVLYTIRDAPP